MSKAILIMDMPDCCVECPCSNFEVGRTCEVFGRDIDDETHGLDGKPTWCPLREVPQKKEIKQYSGNGIIGINTMSNSRYAEGYNKCIDEILGGEE